MKRQIGWLVIILSLTATLLGQDKPEQKTEGAPKPSEHKHKSTKSDKPMEHDHHPMPAGSADISEMDHGEHGEMSSSINIGEPMARSGSGTSWIPDSSPMHAYMKMYPDGSHLMVHGTMFFRYTRIGSERDVSVAGKGSRQRFDAPSMFMAMYTRPINSKSQFGFRAMASLDPVIEGGYGYPLLYQSGELYRGLPLHDRQHPHDFISELAVTYSYKFDEKNSIFIYAGLPGEPALGPPMYLHRPSGMNIPDAPIGHHWQDASHITFGVVTAGFTHGKFKVEGSAFNGTEPDDRRFAFDKPRLNSFSGRVSYNPTKNMALQLSHGYLRNPERAEPELKLLHRTTASIIYNKQFGENRNWSSSLVWGRNSSVSNRSDSFLFETNYELERNSIFGRLERVQKDAYELALDEPHPSGNFWLGSYSIGYLREIRKNKGVDVGIGGMATFNTNPKPLEPFYGGTRHAGAQLFVRIRPSRTN